jgi:hypothetical protein
METTTMAPSVQASMAETGVSDGGDRMAGVFTWEEGEGAEEFAGVEDDDVGGDAAVVAGAGVDDGGGVAGGWGRWGWCGRRKRGRDEFLRQRRRAAPPSFLTSFGEALLVLEVGPSGAALDDGLAFLTDAAVERRPDLGILQLRRLLRLLRRRGWGRGRRCCLVGQLLLYLSPRFYLARESYNEEEEGNRR